MTTSVSTETSTRDSADTSLSTSISTETSTRGSVDTSLSTVILSIISTSGDTSLSTDISTETSVRSSDDISLSTSISTESSTRGSADTSLSTSISSETSSRTSVDDSLSTGLSTHNHYQLYQPNGTNPFVYTDNAGTLHIDGSIIQSGVNYDTHAEQLYTEKDTIILRDGAIGGLGSGYTGLIAKLYDGANDGQFVFDSGGTARVGDIGSLQPLATRIETPINGNFAYWDSGNTRLDFKSLSISDIDTLSSTLSTEASSRTSADTSLSTSVSTEVSTRGSADTSLSTSVSTETSVRASDDVSLSTSISTETSVRGSADTSLTTVVSTNVSKTTSLSTSVSTEASVRGSADTSLSTSVSTEASVRTSADTSIVTSITNLAGSGLTYNVPEAVLDVVVDDWTIGIINNTLVAAQEWVQYSSSIVVSGATSGVNSFH